MYMKAHILGNGPSIQLYNPQDGFVIGCNFHEYPVDLTVLVDCKPFMIYKGKRELLPNRKIITSKYAWPTIEEQKLVDEFEYVHIVEQLEQYKSAGHIATEWALNNGYDEIHLWGFNSIFEDSQETKTDLIVPRSRAQFDLFIHWRERWKEFTQYNITVHNTLQGTQLKELL
jgi:hypothetical protein